MLRQVRGKQRRHSMGTALFNPSVVTHITSERTGSTTGPSKRRVSGRALHGHQIYAKQTAFSVDIFQVEICALQTICTNKAYLQEQNSGLLS